MTRIVLVHGAFAGAWSWEPVIGPLQAAGHDVTAVELPGSGSDPTPAEEVTLDGYAQRIGEALAAGDEPALLVGHSMGGIAITHTAGHDASHIKRLLYVTAFLPADGQSLLDLANRPEGEGDQIQANMIVTPPVASLTDEGARKAIYNCCTEAQIEVALPLRHAQALAPMGTPASRGAGFDEIHRDYVHCLQDHAIPIANQRRMVADDGHISKTFELDTDHAPMLSKTAELVAIIDEVAGD